MTKILNFALKIKGGGREGGTCEVLRPCHPPNIWNVHKNKSLFEAISDSIAFEPGNLKGVVALEQTRVEGKRTILERINYVAFA